MPSFLDILAPSRVPDTEGIGRRSGPADIESCIRFDMESLLNARRAPDAYTEGFVELPRSITNYGLRDYAFAEMESREQRELVARHIEDVLAIHEPRLTAVHVESQDPEPLQTVVNFKITARLRGPGGESVSGFQNTFEWTTGHHEVSSS